MLKHDLPSYCALEMTQAAVRAYTDPHEVRARQDSRDFRLQGHSAATTSEDKGELVAAAVGISTSALLIPRDHIVASGVALTAMYVVYLPVAFLSSRSVLILRWSTVVIRLFVPLSLASIVVFVSARLHALTGAIICVGPIVLWSAATSRRLRSFFEAKMQ